MQTRHAMFFVINVLALNVVACGGIKSEDQQAQEFYDEKLNSAAQKDCNAKGYMYSVAHSTCLDAREIRLAKWSCSKSGVEKELTRLGFGAEKARHVSRLGDFLDDGWKAHQCGQNERNELFVELIRTSRTDSQARIEFELWQSFTGFASAAKDGGATDTETAPQSADAEPYEAGGSFRVNTESHVGVGECVPFEVVALEGGHPNGDVVAPRKSDLKVFLSASTTRLKTFSDAGCKSSIDSLTVKKGQSSAKAYFRVKNAGEDDLVVKADDFGTLLTQIVAD